MYIRCIEEGADIKILNNLNSMCVKKHLKTTAVRTGNV